jgi:threonylcarbamoyladenosine tRNA methylthiotransferase MtaB
MKYAIVTFGCRVNQADSFEFEESLRARGGVAAPAGEADLVVVNTCSVTGAADQGARRLIRQVARTNARARIVVTGCYATRRPEDLASLPQVVRLVPNDEKPQLAIWLRSEDLDRGRGGFHSDWGRGGLPLDGGRGGLSAAPGSDNPPRPLAVGDPPRDLAAENPPRPRTNDGDDACGTHLEPGAMGRTAVPLRVQTGCEEHCAFCIIPATRGASRSLPVEEVCRRAGRLAEAGYKEVWLVGVHLGSYGRDLPAPSSLLALLRALDRVPGDLTFRISSLEPMDCAPGIVDLVAASGRFLPHFHLPLQHGSDRVLERMHRPYSIAFYADLAGRIRAALPHAAIGTDLLVGFPGEREDDAELGARNIEALPLTSLHVFPYSDRPGTEASAITPKVDPRDVRLRAARLREAGRRMAEGFARAQVGRVRPGLTLEDGTLVLTDNFLKVRIPAGLPRNTRVMVQIAAADPALTGQVV